ncbi:MAG: pantoate--beta-alanine ligase [Bacteriovoracaceae bacterium]
MIEILRTTEQFQIFRKHIKTDLSIGLVPTMGNLHKGHLSLAKESLRANDITVVSIFVNPMQFGPNEDFEKYPRTLGEDAQLLKELFRSEGFPKSGQKRLVIFAPESVEEVFPSGYQTKIEVGQLTDKLCGLNRPGHFEGVTTVVYQLFNIVKPTRAYFGQKDYQQYIVIKKMIHDLRLDVQIIPMPIKRDDNGLALSSRNQYLSENEMELALNLPVTLNALKQIIKSNPWPISYELCHAEIEKKIKSNTGWDYLELLDAKTLESPQNTTHTVIIAGALKVGTTRLIDNKLAEVVYA